ncbi:CHAT domain-containing protein [Microcoleus sp. herbarium12]|jgi:CHAT domain/FHA domain|uniref:CHAT domain-containing protein n=1 Tax=Microcoleus sp. herbarium12 TaxID=3055437 RepID=UPI002FD10B78
MARPESPCLSIAIARLRTSGANHFATWVLQAPYPSGYVHHDCMWPDTLSESWKAWQEMFSPSGTIHSLPLNPEGHFVSPEHHQNILAKIEQRSPESLHLPLQTPPVPFGLGQPGAGDRSEPKWPAPPASYSSRLMQHLGINLWQWLFEGPIQGSLQESKGIAIGQNLPLRVRIDLREPYLIALPWEIMQPQAGQPAISLSQQLLFSRTTSNVEPLPPLRPAESLNILLVLGQAEPGRARDAEFASGNNPHLQLEAEAAALAGVLKNAFQTDDSSKYFDISVSTRVDPLIEPTPAELISRLETQAYNILFYAGHGIPGPDGGLLFLGPDTAINGTELAQVLVRCRVTLAVFNACWGAQPAVERLHSNNGEQHAIARSSLAEVLIHHGVPAVLGMRDSIADREALSFIQTFAQALAGRMSIDRAVAVARQQLLTLYKFNQPAWTLPVLYMHPEFDGQLTEPVDDLKTELPLNSSTWLGRLPSCAYLRGRDRPNVKSTESGNQVWPISAGMVRVGRWEENDVVIREQWVSQKHAEIFCRNSIGSREEPSYFLRDFSRYGTLVLAPEGWVRVHHQELLLRSGTQLKFGSSQGQVFEFTIEVPQTSGYSETDCGTN